MPFICRRPLPACSFPCRLEIRRVLTCCRTCKRPPFNARRPFIHDASGVSPKSLDRAGCHMSQVFSSTAYLTYYPGQFHPKFVPHNEATPVYFAETTKAISEPTGPSTSFSSLFNSSAVFSLSFDTPTTSHVAEQMDSPGSNFHAPQADCGRY